jgi:hypothetical protein
MPTHLRLLSFSILACLLGGCGQQPQADAAPVAQAPETAGAEAPRTDAAPAAPADAPTGIVVHVAAGGEHPDRFCMPQWGIANRTDQDVGALLVHMEWRTRSGEVMKPAGEFGTMVEPFAAGTDKDFSLDGHATACSNLRVVVTTYACRDANAVRMPCPAPLQAQASDGIEIDLSGAQEGPMKGAVEG